MDETEEERRRSPRIIVLLPLIEGFEGRGRGRGLRLVFGARKLAVVGAIPPPIPPPIPSPPPLPPA